GGGIAISGSTPAGGHTTPSVRSSLSLKVSLDGFEGCRAAPFGACNRCSSEHALGSRAGGGTGVFCATTDPAASTSSSPPVKAAEWARSIIVIIITSAPHRLGPAAISDESGAL